MVRRSPLAGLGRGIRRGIGRGMWLSRPGASQVQSHAEAKRLHRCARRLIHESGTWSVPSPSAEVVLASAEVKQGLKPRITKAVQLAMDPTDPDWQRRR